MANYFDELLETIADADDRKALATLGQKHAVLRDGVMRQSDYSRKQDELKAKTELADAWEAWKQDNWVEDRKLTVGEVAREATIAELQARLEAAGNGEGQMTFAELDKVLKDRKVLTADEIGAHVAPIKEEINKAVKEQIEAYGGAHADLFVKTLPIALKHHAEYGEVLDVEAMFTAGVKAGVKDIGQCYELFTAEKRAAKQAAEVEKLKKDSFEEGRKAALTETTMGQNGRMPVDTESPGMGHFERQLFQTKTEAEKTAAVVPDEVPLGGGVGRFVAQAFRREIAEKQLAR